MPRRRFQSGRVYQRGTRWVGSYRDYEANPETGKRTRHTITFNRRLHRSVPPKLPFNHTWTITTPGPKQISNPQRHEAKKQSERSLMSGLTRFCRIESLGERVRPCRTFAHTFFRSLARFHCVN